MSRKAIGSSLHGYSNVLVRVLISCVCPPASCFHRSTRQKNFGVLKEILGSFIQRMLSARVSKRKPAYLDERPRKCIINDAEEPCSETYARIYSHKCFRRPRILYGSPTAYLDNFHDIVLFSGFDSPMDKQLYQNCPVLGA